MQCLDENEICKISVYAYSVDKTAQLLQTTLSEIIANDVKIFIEVPKGQIENIQNRYQGNEILIFSESPYTYKQISFIEKSEFIINLNMENCFQDDTDDKSDNASLVYKSTQHLSTLLCIYYFKKSEFSLNSTMCFIEKGSFQNDQDEQIWSSNQLQIYQHKSYLDSFVQDKSFLEEKIQHQHYFNKIYHKQISQQELDETSNKYRSLFDKFWSISYLFLTNSEIELIIKDIKDIELVDINNEENLDLIIINCITRRITILFDKQFNNLEFKEINQQYLSIYMKQIEDAIRIIQFLYYNTDFKLIEVLNDQYSLIIQRVSNFLNIPPQRVEKRIKKSSLDYEHIHLLIKFNYLPQELFFENDNIIFSSFIFFLSVELEIDNLKNNGKSSDEALQHAFLSLVSRAGSQHFYRFAENIFGRQNLFKLFNGILDWFIKLLPKNVNNLIASNIFSHEVGGAAAQTSFRKFFRTNLVSQQTMGIFFSLWDFQKYIRGQLQGSEFVRSQIKNAGSSFGATMGGSFGMILGPVGSIAGAAVGGLGGYYGGDFIQSKIRETNAEKVAKFAENKFKYYQIVLIKSEIDEMIDQFRKFHLKNIVDDYFKEGQSSRNWNDEVIKKIIDILKKEFTKRKQKQLQLEDASDKQIQYEIKIIINKLYLKQRL